jgi:hypothetical protein
MKNLAFFGLQSDEEFVEITLMIEIKIFSNTLFRIIIQ